MTEATTAVFSCTYRRRNGWMRVVIFRDKVHRRKAERSTTRKHFRDPIYLCTPISKAPKLYPVALSLLYFYNEKMPQIHCSHGYRL